MIVVLTLGRSGSSLLMQTLHHLGLHVVGRRFDNHPTAELQQRHMDRNPGGYLEDPAIYYGGPSSAAFQGLLTQPSVEQACKMDVRHFVAPEQSDAWLAAAAHISTLFVSFREPAEQAHSEASDVATGETDAAVRHFGVLTRFMTDYRDTYGQVAGLLAGPMAVFHRKAHFIDYAEIADPDKYVARIVAAVGMDAGADRVAAAQDNISSDLYRVKGRDLPAEEQDFARRLGALETYTTLVDLARAGAARAGFARD